MLKTINLDDIVYELRRVKGQRISITINRQGCVKVSAPYYSNLSTINRFIEQKRDWILEKKEEIEKYKKNDIDYSTGGKLLYLGEWRSLNVVDDDEFAVKYENNSFYLNRQVSFHAKDYLTGLYKNLAWNCFAPKVQEFAQKYQFRYNKLKINSAATKWGSCSATGNINLSWRLVMARESAVDYVIIHELAHTIEHNHSERFWSIVQKILPDYQAEKIWLKDNSKFCDL